MGKNLIPLVFLSLAKLIQVFTSKTYTHKEEHHCSIASLATNGMTVSVQPGLLYSLVRGNI